MCDGWELTRQRATSGAPIRHDQPPGRAALTKSDQPRREAGLPRTAISGSSIGVPVRELLGRLNTQRAHTSRLPACAGIARSRTAHQGKAFLSISSRAPGTGLLPVAGCCRGQLRSPASADIRPALKGIHRSLRQPQSIGQCCGPERSLGAMAICLLWCAITPSVSLPHNEIDPPEPTSRILRTPLEVQGSHRARRRDGGLGLAMLRVCASLPGIDRL